MPYSGQHVTLVTHCSSQEIWNMLIAAMVELLPTPVGKALGTEVYCAEFSEGRPKLTSCQPLHWNCCHPIRRPAV